MGREIDDTLPDCGFPYVPANRCGVWKVQRESRNGIGVNVCSAERAETSESEAFSKATGAAK